MKVECTDFRSRLQGALAGRPRDLAPLVAEAHARECPACAAVVASERALERMLARVPAPAAPPGLAARIRSGLATERGSAVTPDVADDGLEELLASIPGPRVPPELPERVLASLADARGRGRTRGRWNRWLVAAAALLLLVGARFVWSIARAPQTEPEANEFVVDPEVDEELLAYAVENWELLTDEDLDVWLASLDPVDELLLEYAESEALLEDEPLAAPPVGAGR